MAFNAVIHYPTVKEDKDKLIETFATYRVLIVRDYLNKLETSSGNKIKIIDSMLQDEKK